MSSIDHAAHRPRRHLPDGHERRLGGADVPGSDDRRSSRTSRLRAGGVLRARRAPAPHGRRQRREVEQQRRPGRSTTRTRSSRRRTGCRSLPTLRERAEAARRVRQGRQPADAPAASPSSRRLLYEGGAGTRASTIKGAAGDQARARDRDRGRLRRRPLLNSRVRFSATFYKKQITDLLLQAPIVPSTGFTTQYLNGGQITNRGTELELDVTPYPARHDELDLEHHLRQADAASSTSCRRTSRRSTRASARSARATATRGSRRASRRR